MSQQIRTRTGQDATAAILAAALDTFQQVGIERTTLAAISARLHVTKAAIYHHFKSKDAIVDATLAPLVAAVDTLLADVAAGSVPSHQLSDEVIDIALDHRELVLLCQPGALAGLGAETEQKLHDVSERLLNCLAAAADPPSPLRGQVLLGGLGAVLAAGSNGQVPADRAELKNLARTLITQR